MSPSARLGLALAACTAALGFVLWRQSARIDALESREPPRAHTVDPDELADLHARVERLSEAIEDLRAAPQTPRRAPPTDTPAPSATRDTVVAALTGNDRVAAHFRALIEEERESRQAARLDRIRETMAQRVRAQVADLADAVDLTARQREQIEARLLEERDAIPTLFQDAQRDGTWREAREAATDLRAATDASVRDLLEPEQYEAYEKMRHEMRWGPRSHGRSGGPPP